jgi:site-specific recombinase XerD
MPDNSSLGYWVRRFLMEYLVHERGLSRNTQQSYRDAFRLFLPYSSRQTRVPVDRLTIDDISPELVVAFLGYLETDRASTAITRNQRLATLHAFARFVAERAPEAAVWCARIRSIPFKRHDRNSVPYLEKEEMDALLSAPDRSTRQGRRDHAILLFLYNSGARATEAVKMAIEDLSWDSTGTGSVKLNGKGRKVRFCPLWKKTMVELKPLIAGRPEACPVFINRYGDEMTRFGLNALVERYVQLAGRSMPSLTRKRVSPHSIRHTTATHLLRAGVDINTIRAWLGHVSIETTNVYAETDLSMKARALEACAPKACHTSRRKRWRDDPGLLEFLQHL